MNNIGSGQPFSSNQHNAFGGAPKAGVFSQSNPFGTPQKKGGVEEDGLFSMGSGSKSSNKKK
jgi:hypothetical protein